MIRSRDTDSSPRIAITYLSFDTDLREDFKRRWSMFLCALTTVVLVLPCLLASWWLIRDTSLRPPDPEVPQPPSSSLLREFSEAAVCTDGPPCSKIGRDILKAGGSAVDSAIAALFCNGLINSQSMGLGGGFMMTVYAKGKVRSLNARETAPASAHKNMYYGNTPEKALSRTGGLAVGVPGELRGYHEAWKEYGRLKWSDLVDPTVKLCEEGYNLTQPQFDALSFRPNVILDDPIFKEMFVNPETGKVRRIGTIIKPKKICETLRIISLEGGNAIHNGSLTRILVEDIQSLGGKITMEDFNKYKAEWREPVSVRLSDGHEVYSVPPPGSGPLVTYILSILDGYRMNKPANLTEEILTVHRTIEAFKFAFARRTELGDPNYVNITELLQNLTSMRYAEETRHRIQDNQTSNDPKQYGGVFYSQEDHGTAHISVISPDGDAVSVTSTINLYFGAGYTSPGTGIILNSVMDDFSVAGQKNYFDLPPSPANMIEPGKRPLSSACPTIVLAPDRSVRLVIGASGGTKITTAVSWVIMRHLWFHEDVKRAVDASRIHHQLEPMEISYEYGVLKQVIQGLEKLGHKTKRYRERGSIICAVAKEDGRIFANADFRKGGEVYGFAQVPSSTTVQNESQSFESMDPFVTALQSST